MTLLNGKDSHSNISFEPEAAANGGREQRIRHILRNLEVLAAALQEYTAEVERQTGLDSNLIWVMWELHDNPGMDTPQLARTLTFHESICADALTELREKGLVYRVQNDHGGATERYRLSAKGIELLLATAPRPVQGPLARAIHELPSSDLTRMDAFLVFLLNNPEIRRKLMGE